MTLSCLAGGDPKSITMLGSMLFLRCVSGSRVITGVDVKDVHGHKFEGIIECDCSDVGFKQIFAMQAGDLTTPRTLFRT
jgi:hypothetical protein